MNILLLGAGGQLGWELSAALAPLGRLTALKRAEADLSRPESLDEAVKRAEAHIIVNAAAHTGVDKAESEEALAMAVNAESPARLAELARRTGAWLLHYSTDYVFDGFKEGPYTEKDPANPLNVYGRSKLAGEQAVQAGGGRHLIFRTSWVFSRRGHNFPRTILALALKQQSLTVVNDQVGNPTSADFLALASTLALRRALETPEDLSGLYHLVSSRSVSWHGLAVFLAEKALAAGWPLALSPEQIKPIATLPSARPALRPANSRLSTEKFQKVFDLHPPDWSWYAERLIESWQPETLQK